MCGRLAKRKPLPQVRLAGILLTQLRLGRGALLYQAPPHGPASHLHLQGLRQRSVDFPRVDAMAWRPHHLEGRQDLGVFGPGRLLWSKRSTNLLRFLAEGACGFRNSPDAWPIAIGLLDQLHDVAELLLVHAERGGGPKSEAQCAICNIHLLHHCGRGRLSRSGWREQCNNATTREPRFCDATSTHAMQLTKERTAYDDIDCDVGRPASSPWRCKGRNVKLVARICWPTSEDSRTPRKPDWLGVVRHV